MKDGDIFEFYGLGEAILYYNTAQVPLMPDKKKKRSLMWYSTLYLVAIATIIPFYLSNQANGMVYNIKYGALALFIVASVKLNVTKTNDATIKKSSIFPLVVLLYAVCSINLINLEPGMSISKAAMDTIVTCLIGTLAVYVFPKISFELFRSILFIFLITLFAAVTVPSFVHINDLYSYYSFGGRNRFVGVFSNANEMARFALLGVLIPLRLWSLYKQKRFKLFFIMMIILNIYIIHLSDSRASLLVGVLAIVLFLVGYLYLKLPKILFFAGIFTASGIILGAALYITAMLMSGTFDFESVSSGRLTIWLGILSSSTEGLLFGTGPMQNIGSHNGFLEVVKNYGFLGLGVWLLLICILLRQKMGSSLNVPSLSNIQGVSIVLLFMLYYFFEGGLISVGNLASVYFWLELTQKNEAM